ncbi:LysR family transcriptional regulator [Kushneria aurantia]|uniref:LysR family transcriptional regulator n=1 Tax=Kushneria aurantia TaxID=504092 RepID=A0ABV6G644_9GAMM|nr:LysR family transcriptional regulator [Kushneria aurantia]
MPAEGLRWNDLPLVLAIAETGSLAGAARRLAVNHATVFRRLNALERQLAVRLFERHSGGYRPTQAGWELADSAARMAKEVHDAERRLQGHNPALAGTLRITTTDTLLHGLLTPIFHRFRQRYPDILLEVAISNRTLDITRREADIAIRPTNHPPESLIGRCIGSVRQAVYTRRDNQVTQAVWVGPDAAMGYPALERWMREQGVEEAVGYRADSMFGMMSAIRVGMGCGVLPCYLADAEPLLVRVGETVASLDTNLWLLTHADLRWTARVRALFDDVAAVVRATDNL